MTCGELRRRILATLAPPPEITVSQWSDRYRNLSGGSAARQGRWRTKSFQREPMDCVGDPLVSRVVIKSCTQLMKTECILNAIGYFIDVDPGPILVLQPGQQDAEDFSKERIDPMIRECERLREKVATEKSRSSGNTIGRKYFPGGLLAITHSSSPRNLARRAIRCLFADEVDKYVVSAGREGGPLQLARKRLATFRHRAKEIDTCSPTRPGSPIDLAYEESDKREFYVPCPACGHRQSMMGRFRTQVRWDSKAPTREAQAESARYHCEQCGAAWDDVQRWAAVEAGEWRAHADFNGVAGFWISELYSPWKTLAEIVLDFLKAKDNPEAMMTFINTSLAENWVDQGEAPEWEKLVERRESYPVGTVPRGGLFLTAGADVHPDRIECEVVAWGKGRESWSVDYRILEGKPSDPEVWSELDSLLAETFPTAGGSQFPISKLFIDSGHASNEVYAWVRKQPPTRVIAVKGVASGVLPVGQPSSVDVTLAGKRVKNGLRIKSVLVAFFKAELYADLQRRKPTPEEMEQGFSYPPGYCHFPSGKNYGDEHFRQLCAEQLVSHVDRRNGRLKQEWQQIRPRNEALDCRVYARAAAWDCGLDRFQPKHWSALEAQAGNAFIEKRREPEIKPQPRAAEQPPVPAAPAPVFRQQPSFRRRVVGRML